MILTGIGAAAGIAFGDITLVDRRQRRVIKRVIDSSESAHEKARLQKAIELSVKSLGALREKLIEGEHGEHSAILDAHLLMMNDPMLLQGAHKHIDNDHQCAEWALSSVLQDIRKSFAALNDTYFRERSSDVDFVGERILMALAGDHEPIKEVGENAIVVTYTLSPADTLRLMRRGLKGFITEAGGATGHTAILARALNVPAVVGCEGVLEHAANAKEIIVDGARGEVVFSPSEATTNVFETRAKNESSQENIFAAEVGEQALTACGHPLNFLANVELPFEVKSALSQGASGIGLYRSEFLFLGRDTLPNEDEQFETYCELLETLAPGMPAHLRLLDVGSDKMSKTLRIKKSDNPALGVRACRLAKTRPDVFRTQVRAMVRAIAKHSQASILLPLIADVSEFSFVKNFIEGCVHELENEGVRLLSPLRLGVMIELPSAVFCAEELAKVCDYFSVGSNDLVQYLYGADRGNPMVAERYDAFGTAHLRALAHVTTAAKAAEIPVSICGSWASLPRALPFIVALGFDSVSMPASMLARAKYALRRLRKNDAEVLLSGFLSGREGFDEVDALLPSETLLVS